MSKIQSNAKSTLKLNHTCCQCQWHTRFEFNDSLESLILWNGQWIKRQKISLWNSELNFWLSSLFLPYLVAVGTPQATYIISWTATNTSVNSLEGPHDEMILQTLFSYIVKSMAFLFWPVSQIIWPLLLANFTIWRYQIQSTYSELNSGHLYIS